MSDYESTSNPQQDGGWTAEPSTASGSGDAAPTGDSGQAGLEASGGAGAAIQSLFGSFGESGSGSSEPGSGYESPPYAPSFGEEESPQRLLNPEENRLEQWSVNFAESERREGMKRFLDDERNGPNSIPDGRSTSGR